MKVLCKKTLYWHQKKGYSGMLLADKTLDKKDGIPVLIAGNKYETVAIPTKGSTGLEYINLYAIGKDGKAYCIMDAEVCRCSTDQALAHFAFDKVKPKIAE
jgi:hypothetical protein